MPFPFITDFAPALFMSAAKRRAVCLLAAFPAMTAMAQQSAPLPSIPFPTSRSVAWDGEIMDNLVLRYRRVLFYPQAVDRLTQAWQGLMDTTLLRRVCTIPPEWTEATRRSLGEYEKTIYLSGLNKREEIRTVKVQRSESRNEHGCPEPPVVVHRYSVEISTPERNIKFSRTGDQSRVRVHDLDSEGRGRRLTEGQRRLRDARNPRTRIGRSMGRVWTEEAAFNGFRCGANSDVNKFCTFLDQPRHVGTNTLIPVRIATDLDARCEQDPTDDETRTMGFLLTCAMLGAWELVDVQQNARLSQDLFEMPPEARGLPVHRVRIPEADEDGERD